MLSAGITSCCYVALAQSAQSSNIYRDAYDGSRFFWHSLNWVESIFNSIKPILGMGKIDYNMFKR